MGLEAYNCVMLMLECLNCHFRKTSDARPMHDSTIVRAYVRLHWCGDNNQDVPAAFASRLKATLAPPLVSASIW